MAQSLDFLTNLLTFIIAANEAELSGSDKYPADLMGNTGCLDNALTFHTYYPLKSLNLSLNRLNFPPICNGIPG